MRQVKIYDDTARFVEHINAVEGTKSTFAAMFDELVKEKYGEKWEAFAKMAGIPTEKGKSKQ